MSFRSFADQSQPLCFAKSCDYTKILGYYSRYGGTNTHTLKHLIKLKLGSVTSLLKREMLLTSSNFEFALILGHGKQATDAADNLQHGEERYQAFDE
jgi:hypothetical protein